MRYWKKLNQDELKSRVFNALDENLNYLESSVLGVPATYLDDRVFSQDVSFLKDAPFITALVKNPNHIGCHTLGKSESFFKGTQQIELELIQLVAEDILQAPANSIDGYVASGGTEANIQAMWMYRNYFREEFHAKYEEIAIITSSDAHYSMVKGGDLLNIDVFKVSVTDNERTIDPAHLMDLLDQVKGQGKKYVVVIVNMMTTMFGSVDDLNLYSDALDTFGFEYRVHVDGAYGGFYYPFADKTSTLNFANPKISSFTLDAHKMAQAPYGTGIFLTRKGLIQYTNTSDASYVEGEDYTLIGSRSGANAIAVWMILMKHGPYGWFEKIFVLQKRTEWMCDKLNALGIRYYRHPSSNIITMRAEDVQAEIASKFGLVPDNHKAPKWYKIVVMEHVTIEKMMALVDDITGVTNVL